MKKVLLSFLLFTLCPFVLKAQKAKTDRHKFSYIQMPEIVFTDDSKIYKVETVLAYEDERAERMEQYEMKVKAAEAEHAKQVAAFDSASTGEKLTDKLLFGKGKPADKPTLPPKPYFRNLYNPDEFSRMYGNIKGLTPNDDAQPTLRLILMGFEGSPQFKKKDKNGKPFYEVTLSYPLKVQLISAQGAILHESYVNDSEKSKNYRVNHFINDKERFAYFRVQEEKIIRGHLEKVEEYVSDIAGFSEKEYLASVVQPTGKKHDYSDYEQARQAAALGYQSIMKGGEKELLKAIAVWEKALEESDVQNKKSRVNKHITAATQCSLAEAYMWLNDFEKTERYLMLAKLHDIGRYNRRIMLIEDFLKGYRTRFEASKHLTLR